MFQTKVLLLVLLHSVFGDQISFCTSPKHEELCEEFNKRDFPLKCSIYSNSIDCLLQIEKNKTDLAVVTAELALVANKLIDNLDVIAELRLPTSKSDAAYETVVVVKMDFNGTFNDLKGKKYCHPGFHHQQTTTSYVLKKFETTVLNYNHVDVCQQPGDTLFEKELAAISGFFGPSCRPGPWLDLENKDQVLYSNYSSLCDLCENKFCDETSDSYKYPFDGAFQCFLTNGEVALTSRNVVESYIKTNQERVNFQFLCPDGSLSKTVTTECIWSKEPSDLIIGNKNSSIKAQNLLKSFKSSSNYDFFWNDILEQSQERVNYLPVVNLRDYLKPFVNSVPDVNYTKTCNLNLTWCTTSKLEKAKCEWFSEAASNRGILPKIQCRLRDYKIECIEDVKNEQADLVVINANQSYIAKRHKLHTAAFIQSANNTIKTVLLVNESRVMESGGILGLAQKSACFPQYGGIEWLAFIHTITQYIPLKWPCNYRQYFGEFIGVSCLPGAHDVEYELTKDAEIYLDKFCGACIATPTAPTATTCNTDFNNMFYGGEGALNCLKQFGDYAVVQKGHYKVDMKHMRVMCKNGSFAIKSDEDDLFDLEEDCYLSVTVNEEVVSNEKSEKEVTMLLMQYERWFGTSAKSFQLFNKFDNVSNVIFQDSTIGFDFPPYETEYLKNYVKLLLPINRCDNGKVVGGGVHLVAPLFLILSMLIAVY